MRQLFWISIFIFTLSLSTNLSGQTIWSEEFHTPDKGIWADENGNITIDYTDINWTIDTVGCEFSDENDYAKTVTTGEGRFEVLDSDGEIIWLSEQINIEEYDVVNISILTGETGSSTQEDKKYIKAYYILDRGSEVPFSPTDGYAANWSGELTQQALNGGRLQIAVHMNSSYANDKVYMNSVTVTALDSSTLKPAYIQITQSPLLAFTNYNYQISAAIYNSSNDLLNDSTLTLSLTSDFDTNDSNFENGIYSWQISSNQNGEINYSVSLDNSQLNTADSIISFFNMDDAVLFQDFEDDNYPNWDFGTDWERSNTEPISGDYSMKHYDNAVNNPSILLYDNADIILSEEEYFFSFKLKNTNNWDPSSSNNFYLFLHSGDEPTNNTGYAVGVNASGSTDFVSFWTVSNNEPNKLIAETTFDWDENTLAQINLSRTPQGEWNLNVIDLENGENSSVNFSENSYNTIDNFQLVFNYSSTRIGTLFFDDFIIVGQNAAPFIANAAIEEANKFRITFNEDIQWNNISTSSFKLSGENTDYTISDFEKINERTALITTETISDVTLTIFAYNISDLEGEITTETSFEFENSSSADEYDLVISEIMADPNPVVELPEAEYIEIHNCSNKNIQLENYELFVRSSTYTLPEYLIQPDEYLIICDDEYLDSFNVYGSVLALDRFPSLLNGGTTIKIIDTNGTTIDQITYSDDWYYDTDKDNGGYSLERIDDSRTCGQSGNWTASTDEKGGTPGATNSVAANNPDNEAPEAISVNIVAYNQIEIYFSEEIDSTSAKTLSNYAVNNLNIDHINYEQGTSFVTIYFNSNMEINTDYTISISNISDECGNVMASSSLDFSIVVLEEGDLLINEVLFNPYTDGSDFVEIYNNSDKTIDLQNLKLANRNDTLGLKSVSDLSDISIRISPSEYVVVTKDSANIADTYYVSNPEFLIQADNMPAFNNADGYVVLLDDSLTVIDELAYNENMHSEWLTDYNGVSLERLSFDESTNNASNWASASSIAGYATPTYKNSQEKIEEEQKLEILLESDIVSPNGDNYNDELIISFQLDKADYLANIYVFNATGQKIKQLTNNDLVGGTEELTYDLRKENGDLLPMGAYILFAELTNWDGQKEILKKSFFVTDKL